MSHLFISYSKQNIAFARYLRALLETEGCPVWMDEIQLEPSARWWKAIEESITACAAMVVIMTPDAAESDWVEREILLAEKLRRPLFPVLLAGESWSRLANIQYEDLREGLRAKPSARFIDGLKGKLGVGGPAPGVTLQLVQGDITEYPADVAAFKYSDGVRGAAEAVAHRLTTQAGVQLNQLSAERVQFTLVPSQGAVSSPQLMYIGSARLRHFGYQAVRELGRNALRGLALHAPETRHLAMTLNGPGTSLDENEAFLHQLRGYLDALDSGEYPAVLERITIIERNEGRFDRIRAFIGQTGLQQPDIAERCIPFGEAGQYRLLFPQGDSPASASAPVSLKPHVFVALPQSVDLEDEFFYGIQTPVHGRGLLCERIEDPLNDELIEQAKARISSARLVVADLTKADPLVYLQIGFAWGCNRPVILIQRDDMTALMGIPARSYSNIKSLEKLLSRELDSLSEKGLL
jgi:hypothetical protein